MSPLYAALCDLADAREERNKECGMNDSRKAFEEWAEAFGLPLDEHPTNPETCYAVRDATFAWQGWSARDSEVERLREALAGLVDFIDAIADGRIISSLRVDDFRTSIWPDSKAVYDAACAALSRSSQDKESGK